MNLRRELPILFSLGLAMVLGCGSPSPLGVSVRGTVTADTLPLAEGLITFIPIGGTTGHKCSVLIQDGNYAIEPAQGLEAGPYRVEVMGLPPGIKALAEGRTPTHSPSSYREISPRFNEKSDLRCTLQFTGENRADFSVSFIQ